MGFKDLVKFSEAMLAKQVKYLLTDHNSLFYRVFQANTSLEVHYFMPRYLQVPTLGKVFLKLGKLSQQG